MAEAEGSVRRYLALPHTRLKTERQFVVNAFVLYRAVQGHDARERRDRLHDQVLHGHDSADGANDRLPDAVAAQ